MNFENTHILSQFSILFLCCFFFFFHPHCLLSPIYSSQFPFPTSPLTLILCFPSESSRHPRDIHEYPLNIRQHVKIRPTTILISSLDKAAQYEKKGPKTREKSQRYPPLLGVPQKNQAKKLQYTCIGHSAERATGLCDSHVSLCESLWAPHSLFCGLCSTGVLGSCNLSSSSTVGFPELHLMFVCVHQLLEELYDEYLD